MQTLKTAAIVVLMMAVIYGAYVSMTKPPETLPEDVQDLFVVDEGTQFDSDLGLPESLGGTSLGGTSLGGTSLGGTSLGTDEAVSPGDVASVSLPNPGSPTAAEATTLTGPDPATGPLPLADIGNTLPPAESPATQADIARAVARDQYLKTESEFALPNPNNVNSDFQRSGVALPPHELAQSGGTETAAGQNAAGQNAGVGASQIAPVAAVMPPNIGLANAIRTADMQFTQDKRKDALATLSLFYNTPDISGEQRSEMLARLDPLAREVIYSKRHLLEQPYRIHRNETLEDVARIYDVPWQLLANINGIKDPVTVLPGTELKVVRGPFRAEISLTLKELTLFMGDFYAGRFPIGVGSDPAPTPGFYTVQDKQTNKTYYNRHGTPVAADNPENPYGTYWMDLGNQLSIHGSPNPTRPNEDGCISLAEDIADDLYGILSQGSSVTIRR